MNNIVTELKTDSQSLQMEAGMLPGIELVEIELMNTFSGSKGIIREMCSHILNAGGKRIRPLLVLYSGMIFNEPSQELIQAAVASELIHMASLVHDDIIDQSGLRRNKPSLNYQWGNRYAVLCGDYLFAKAFGVLAGNQLIKSMDYMVEAIENMCHGEISQASESFNCFVTQEIYYRRIAQKTAILLECSCKSGAAVGGADQIQTDILGEYGLNLGYAFQIMDDILDFCGNPAVMGKPNGEDLRQGTITLPVIELLAHRKYGPYVKEIIMRREINDMELKEVKIMLQESGIIGQVIKTAAVHIQKAKECLALLPQNKYTFYLTSLADMLQQRAN